MRALISDAESYRRKQAAQTVARRAAGMIERAEFEAAAAARRERAKELRVNGRSWAEVAKIMAQPEVKKILVDLGADPISVDPDGFAAYIRRENEKWRQLAKDAKISVAN